MGNQFYYTDAANEVQGPCTTLRLMALHKAGELTKNSLVSPQGSDQWVELWTIFPANRIFKFGKTSAMQGIYGIPDEANPNPPNSVHSSGYAIIHPATRLQAGIIILLLLLGLGIPYLGNLRPVPKWEYKKLVFSSEGNERIGPGALKYSSIQMDEELLNLMGKEGWEMTGSYLEMETAFPNFNEENYAIGLQSNTRPQALVVLFKRPR